MENVDAGMVARDEPRGTLTRYQELLTRSVANQVMSVVLEKNVSPGGQRETTRVVGLLRPECKVMQITQKGGPENLGGFLIFGARKRPGGTVCRPPGRDFAEVSLGGRSPVCEGGGPTREGRS